MSVIPIHVAERLGLEMRGQRVARYADGRSESVGVTEPIVFEIQSRDTLEEAMVVGDEVLSGKRCWRSSICWRTAPAADLCLIRIDRISPSS